MEILYNDHWYDSGPLVAVIRALLDLVSAMKTSTELLREGLNAVGFGYRSCAPMLEGEYQKRPSQDHSREGSDGRNKVTYDWRPFENPTCGIE